MNLEHFCNTIMETEKYSCLIIGSPTLKRSSSSSNNDDTPHVTETSFSQNYTDVYELDDVIFRLLETQNVFIEICQEAKLEIDKNDCEVSLSQLEIDQLEHTAIYEYFKRKNSLFLLAQILEMVFDNKIDNRLVAEFCIYCILIQKTALVIQDAAMIESEKFSILVDLLPNIQKIVFFGVSTNVNIVSETKSNLFKELKEMFAYEPFYIKVDSLSSSEENEENTSIRQKTLNLLFRNNDYSYGSENFGRKLNEVEGRNFSLLKTNYANDNLEKNVYSLLETLYRDYFDVNCTKTVSKNKNIRFVCPTNDLRDECNALCFQWFLGKYNNF